LDADESGAALAPKESAFTHKSVINYSILKDKRNILHPIATFVKEALWRSGPRRSKASDARLQELGRPARAGGAPCG
jgi:valyl-tRNA synthetase